MKNTTWIGLGLVVLGGCQGKRIQNVDVDAACFTEVVTALADDAMEGRGIGTEGLAKAATLIEERFRAAGLSDVGVGYQQPFDVTVGVHLGEGNWLGGSGVEDLAVGKDFQPFGFASDGAFEGSLVFAGYGISAKDLGYDDYADLDVKGKVVLAMRYEPQENNADSTFEGKRPSRYSDLRYKALQARSRGAKALVLVGPARGDSDPDKVPALQSGGPRSRAGIPVLQVTRAVADRWLAKGDAPTLAELHATIDETGAPASRTLKNVTVSGTVEIVSDKAPVRNVLASIPGAGALADEVVVVGAHYDHLGYGGQGSLRPGEHAIHNGADDNASGTAAMVCALERLVKSSDAENRRTILGIAFTAEEIGLGGSSFYTDHPVLPIENTVAMVNLDMVGRLRNGNLQALGADTAPEWRTILSPVAETHGLNLAMGGDGYGASDHTSFYEKKIPVIHLFSGTHSVYHTPDDDTSTLNLEGGATVTGFLVDVTSALSTRSDGLTYVKSTSGPRVVGDSRGRGAYLGTIPDMSAMALTEGGEGVLLSDVRGDGPADRAGLRGGDTIVEMAGVEIQNLYDMTFVLRDHRPGQTIDIVVKRGDERVPLKATLGSRGEAAKR
ncbi:MAG: M28 family peptidase [Myxococcota bacterium]